jgi:hypothetical protein
VNWVLGVSCGAGETCCDEPPLEPPLVASPPDEPADGDPSVDGDVAPYPPLEAPPALHPPDPGSGTTGVVTVGSDVPVVSVGLVCAQEAHPKAPMISPVAAAAPAASAAVSDDALFIPRSRARLVDMAPMVAGTRWTHLAARLDDGKTLPVAIAAPRRMV